MGVTVRAEYKYSAIDTAVSAFGNFSTITGWKSITITKPTEKTVELAITKDFENLTDANTFIAAVSKISNFNGVSISQKT